MRLVNFHIKLSKLFPALALCLILAAGQAWATTYYMRADGSAANKAAATSCSAAATAMSVATHNGETFSAGDIITLCDSGGEFRTTILVPSSGDSGNVITYTASGTPVISSSTTITGWGGGPVYTKAIATNVNGVYEDTVQLQKATTTACVDGNWILNGGTLYYKPTSGVATDHTVVYNDPDYGSGFYVSGKSYITINGLTFRNNWYGVYVNGTSNSITYTNNSFVSCLQGIVHWTTANTSGHLVNLNYFYRCSLGASFLVTSGVPTYTNITVSNNNFIDIGTVDGTVTWSTITNAEKDLESVSGQNLKDSTVTSNTMTGGNNTPVYFYSINGVVLSNNTISRNYVNTSAHTYSGIRLAGDATGGHIGTIIRNNIINNGGTFSIALKQSSNSNAQNFIYNNTIYGGNTGIKIQSVTEAPNYWTVKNNIIYGNSGSNAYIDPAYEATIIFDYNLYGSVTGDIFATFSGVESWTAWKAHGLDSHSISGNPLLTSDYRLSAGSPAIDAGAPVFTAAQWLANGDAAGNHYVFGAGPDIGAYEKKKFIFDEDDMLPKKCKSTNSACYVQP